MSTGSIKRLTFVHRAADPYKRAATRAPGASRVPCAGGVPGSGRGQANGGSAAGSCKWRTRVCPQALTALLCCTLHATQMVGARNFSAPSLLTFR